MIKGAVFDMDGLMFDSERLVYEIWQEMMDEKGLEYSLDVFKQTIGLRADESEKLYKSMYGESFDYQPMKTRCRNTFTAKIAKEGVPVKDGLFEMLDYLKSVNVKTAVATSTSAQTAIKTLKIAGVYDYFDEFVCGDSVVHSKPHPEIFLTAARKIGVLPENCVAFEDSINGIKSAYAANMTPVMVPDYLQPTDEIKPMLAFLCTSLSQAIPFVKTNLI